MKKSDFGFIIIIVLLMLSFAPFGFLESYHKDFLFNSSFWYITSFIKFAILATLGESLGLRISKGIYNFDGFGILPRAIVWGFLGIVIKMAFVIFAVGVPALMAKYFGITEAVSSMKQGSIFDAINAGMGGARVITAFAISVFINLIFAPMFMTLHKITDIHIVDNKGKLSKFFSPIQFGNIFPRVNWFIQWDFVFKKTIPFFWIPAHTITFLVPGEYRIVFAAALGIVLGVLLATASLKAAK